MKILAVIPARYSSTRFPGKPLSMIGDKAMVQWVYDAAIKALSEHDGKVIVATEDIKIYDYCKSAGMNVAMTSVDHVTGTERLMEVASLEDSEYDIYLNIQGDEPLINPVDIKDLIVSVKPWIKIHGEKIVGTLLAILDKEEAGSRDCVKAFTKKNNSQIVLFTRSVFHDYDVSEVEGFRKHVGIYLFTKKSLENICELKDRTKNETIENLEQLRWMDSGIKLIGSFIHNKPISVDTPEDLQKVVDYVNRQAN